MARAELKLNKKQQRYYRYVIDRLMENTLVDVRDQKIWHPYDSHYSRHLIGGAPAIFTYFVKNKFGILPEEVELVWSHYKHRIKDENGWVQIHPMNESLNYSEKEINKQKKQDKFIAYVVKDLINDTYINRITFNDRPISGGEKIDAPFFRINKIGAQSFLGIVGMKWEARELFNDYIKNKYGAVTDGEMNKIFMFYTEEIKELVKDINPESFTYTDNLDESISKNPKQQQLFDYVVNQMVDGTRIVPPGDGTLLLIIPDFINAENASPFLYGRYLKTGVFPIPNYIMLRYFKDTYGLLNDEVQLVWDRYREIMYRKLRKEFPNSFLDDPRTEDLFPHSINEAREHNKGNEEFKRIDNPKQHKFYNNIADKVVDLIVVRDQSWGKDIFLTDLLDPQYPGQGASLVAPINIPDYETFQKRMMTIIQDFFPMLEKYWYIEEFFDQIFILTRFVFPKIWNKFYKGEDQPEESTEYGEHALDYDEKMGKEKITSGSNTSWDDVANNESIDNKLFNINESWEDNYVDRIVDQLIDETYIVKEKRTPRRGKSKWLYFVRNPFMDVTPNFTVFLHVLIQTEPGEQFQKHCREIYGATPDQIKDIWSSYTYYLSEIKPEFDTDSDTLRKAIEPLNESISKKQKFLDTVLRDMINLSTIINNEFDIDTIILPGGTEIFNFNLWDKILTPPEYARDYMRDTYGLVEKEMTHVWLRYKDIMLDRIKKRDALNNPFRINESTKPLPDRVFQLIHGDLFDRTVKLPRTNKPLCTGGERVDYRDFDDPVDVNANQEGVYDQPNFVIQLNLPSSEFPYNVEMGRKRSWGQLNDYLTQQYGLTDEECQRVWDEYRGTICKNAKLPSLNESYGFPVYIKGKQQKVLDYALQDLTDNTLLDWGNSPDDTYQIIRFPFSVYPHKDPTKDRLEWIMIGRNYDFNISQFYDQFKSHVRMMYGLTDVELLNMFAEWETKIIEKIRDHSETDPSPA